MRDRGIERSASGLTSEAGRSRRRRENTPSLVTGQQAHGFRHGAAHRLVALAAWQRRGIVEQDGVDVGQEEPPAPCLPSARPIIPAAPHRERACGSPPRSRPECAIGESRKLAHHLVEIECSGKVAHGQHQRRSCRNALATSVARTRFAAQRASPCCLPAPPARGGVPTRGQGKGVIAGAVEREVQSAATACPSAARRRMRKLARRAMLTRRAHVRIERTPFDETLRSCCLFGAAADCLRWRVETGAGRCHARPKSPTARFRKQR